MGTKRIERRGRDLREAVIAEVESSDGHLGLEV